MSSKGRSGSDGVEPVVVEPADADPFGVEPLSPEPPTSPPEVDSPLEPPPEEQLARAVASSRKDSVALRLMRKTGSL